MKLQMLLLTMWFTAISALAQTPPMPPIITITNNPWMSFTNFIPVEPKKPKTFTVNNCPHCGLKAKGLPALRIETNGMTGTNGGVIVQRTITLSCPNADCHSPIQAKNTIFVPEAVAVEDTASVLPDTNAPSVTLTNLRGALITDFTNRVPFSYSIDTRAFYWLDAETGQQVTKAFEFRFDVQSNNYYTCWVTGTLPNWREYPTPNQLHPARGNFMAGISVPIYDTNRFYTIRSFNGTNRVTWNL